jgi:hypothetical protein
MTTQVWTIVGAACITVMLAGAFLMWRMPRYRWYCGRCKKMVGARRGHPKKCGCGTDRLMAYVCKACSSWNTSPTKNWHCQKCESTKVVLGVEYHIRQNVWRWRNKSA